jgi:hypothetical protein
MDHATDAPSGLTVLLSGGVDSQAVLRALLDAGKEPRALSFYAGGKPSRDWELARATARDLRVPFSTVQLEADPAYLRGYVRWAVEFGLRGKAAIECFYPRRAAISAITSRGDSPGIATGDGGDGYFALSKKALIHYAPGGAEKMDEYRAWYFGRPDWSQTTSIRRYAGELGFYVSMPLADPRLLEACRGWDWEGLNKPRQKEPIRQAFEIPDRIPRHANLQLSDSGIAEAFKALTPEGRRSPVAYYNRVTLEVERDQHAPGLF